MEDPMFDNSLRRDSHTIHTNSNRMEDLILWQEIDGVNKKEMNEIAIQKHFKQMEEPNEEEFFKRQIRPEFMPHLSKRRKMTHQIFYEKDQSLTMPVISAYSSVDPEPKIKLQSRSRKYPYVHKKLITTEEMKKTRISSLGVIPVRLSTEIPHLRVMMEGERVSELCLEKLDSERQSKSKEDVKDNDIRRKEKKERDKEAEEETPQKKPAILPAVGTAVTVKFCERVKPQPKRSYLYSQRKQTKSAPAGSRPNTAQSEHSSLMSREITLADKPGFNYYDDVVDYVGKDDENIETAVSLTERTESQQSKNESVKSVKELLEEAKKISTAGSETLYCQQDSASQFGKHNTIEGQKSVKSKHFAKSVKPDRKYGKDGKGQPKIAAEEKEVVETKRGERTVDEIIASLRDQSAYNRETEADRKIQEVMRRVMSRTIILLTSETNSKEGEETEAKDSAAVGGEQLTPTADTELPDYSPSLTPVLSLKEDESSRADTLASPRTVKDALGAEDQKEEESEREDQSGALSIVTCRTDTVIALDEETGSMEEQEQSELKVRYIEEDDILQYFDIQQAWKDLLAPPETTVEDILSVHGEMKDLQIRKPPAPNTGPKPNVITPSISFLATWAPASAKKTEQVLKPERKFSNNIHHFCHMTTEFQLPHSLMHAGRKYHTPNRFPSVMPHQPYRFKPEELTTVPEHDVSTASTDTRMNQAADRVVKEASKVTEREGDRDPSTLAEWQQKAESLLGDLDLSLAGQPVQIKADESQVYWNPAPPKLGTVPHKVRELLFPQYQLEEFDEFGNVKLPVLLEEESDTSEEEEEEAISPADRAALERTVRKRHNSAETLTAFSRGIIGDNVIITNRASDTECTPDTSGVYDGLSDIELNAKERAVSGVEVQGDTGFAAENLPAMLPREERKTVHRRPQSASNLVAPNDDILIVPQDFNMAMHEITEQKRLLEKTKKQIQEQEGFGELEKLEEEEKIVSIPVVDELCGVTVPQGLALNSVEDELTPTEKALQAGRNYVILPKNKRVRKKKRGHRMIDSAKLEAVEKIITTKSSRKLSQAESMPRLNKVIERDLKVPWKVRSHRSSIPNILNFEEYKTGKKMPPQEDEREWVRGIWNDWFDQVFPPTPEESEADDDKDNEVDPGQAVNKQKDGEINTSKEGEISAIQSKDIDEIEPITETPENKEIYQLLLEEIEKMTESIESTPTAFDYCRRGALYRKIGQLRKAENDLGRAIKMEPELLDAYWHRHLLYILQDRKTAALEDLSFIMKRNKHHSGAYRSMAEIYKRQGDTTMAIISYSSAIKFDPQDHEAYFQRAQIYEEKGDMLLAMENYAKVMKIMPSRTDAIMKHGMYYFENENWHNAISDFTELLKVDPLNATARLFRGQAYAKLSDWVPAVEDLSAAIHLDPYNWQAFYHRACILRKAHPKRALQDYSVSLLLNDSEENLMSYLHRGILYNSLGKPEDAIPDFESVLKLNAEIAAAHVNLGLIYMTKYLNYDRAIKKFSSAVKVDPTYIRAYVCRAEAYSKIHELKNALKDFTRAIHLRPDMQHYYMNRGQLVLQLGYLDLAAFCVHHASELGIDNPAGTMGVSPTQQAVVLSFLKNYEKAINVLQQTVRVQPTAPYYMLLGKTHMKAKQFKEAVDSFKEALEIMKPWKKQEHWPAEAADTHYLAGLCHIELRCYSEAQQQFNHAIRLNPSYADAYYQRGLASVNMKQAKGIQDFNRALAIDPKLFQAYLSRACYYGMKGKYAKAILNCNEAIKLQPKSVRAYLYRGSLKYHIKAYELAILDLSKAASLDTTSPLPYYNRAVCYHAHGQYDKALADYSIVLLLGDMLRLKVLINRGLLYFQRQDYLNALLDFQAAVKLSPIDHTIHHTLGLCFHKLNQLKEAVAIFTHCVNLKPFFLDGLIARGNAFMDCGHEQELEMARRDYQRALRLDPLCLPARINLAYAAQMSGRMMQAWKHFTTIIEVKPNCKPALEGRAIVNLQMSNTFGAFQDISQSVNYGPTAELLTNRGVINQFMGDRVMAMQDYQKAIKLDPAYSLAYFNAGNIYFHTRHFKQALDYYTKAIQYNSRDDSAFLNRAITKVLLHDTKGALEDFNTAAKLSPYSAHIYFNRANLFASLQVYDKAEEEYTKALNLKPDDALTLKRRADVRGKLGRRADAIEDYKRAVDIQTRPNKVISS